MAATSASERSCKRRNSASRLRTISIVRGARVAERLAMILGLTTGLLQHRPHVVAAKNEPGVNVALHLYARAFGRHHAIRDHPYPARAVVNLVSAFAPCAITVRDRPFDGHLLVMVAARIGVDLIDRGVGISANRQETDERHS